MPYYIGDVIKDKNRLVARTPEEFKKTGVDVILGNGVEVIDAEKSQVKGSPGSLYPKKFDRRVANQVLFE